MRALQKEIITGRFQCLLILTVRMSRGHPESHLMFCLLFLLQPFLQARQSFQGADQKSLRIFLSFEMIANLERDRGKCSVQTMPFHM